MKSTTERCLLLPFACSKPKCMAVPHGPARPAAGQGIGPEASGRGVKQAPLQLKTAQQRGHTSHSLEMHPRLAPVGSAGVPHETEATSAGTNRRNLTMWTETINCCHMCQLFLLFSQQLSNSVYLLWRRERKAGKTKMNSQGEEKNNLFNVFFVSHIFKHLVTLTF